MADKKLFELPSGIPLTTDRLAFGQTGADYKNITVSDFKTFITSGSTTIKTATYAIGSWNMDISNSVAVSITKPGEFLTKIPIEKIRSVKVLIISDDALTYSDFLSINNGTALTIPQVYLVTFNFIFDSTLVYLNRKVGSLYDNVAYSKITNVDATPYNRGWVTVDYVD